MAKILKYAPKVPSRKGYRRARKKQIDLEALGQLNLFEDLEKPKEAKLVKLPVSNLFERAFWLDEKLDPLAESVYLEAVNEDKHTADAFCNLGVLSAKRGDTAQAIDRLTKALAHEPRHALSHFNLANLYIEIGNTELAIQHYHIAVHLNPDEADGYFNLAIAYLTTGHNAKSKVALSKYSITMRKLGLKVDERLLHLFYEILAHRS